MRIYRYVSSGIQAMKQERCFFLIRRQECRKQKEEGLEEGREQERETVAKNLLSLGMDTEFVIKATGFDKSDIEKLKTTLHIPSV